MRERNRRLNGEEMLREKREVGSAGFGSNVQDEEADNYTNATEEDGEAIEDLNLALSRLQRNKLNALRVTSTNSINIISTSNEEKVQNKTLEMHFQQAHPPLELSPLKYIPTSLAPNALSQNSCITPIISKFLCVCLCI